MRSWIAKMADEFFFRENGSRQGVVLSPLGGQAPGCDKL